MYKQWFENDNMQMGYKWSIQAKNGIVTISEEELFSRVEFAHIAEDEYKRSYAMDLGWRWNIDNGKWYRIKGY